MAADLSRGSRYSSKYHHKELGDKVELQWKVTKIERRITVLTRQPLKLPMNVVAAKYRLNRSSPFLANVLEPVMPESKSIFRRSDED
jgi:hypothetical protein